MSDSNSRLLALFKYFDSSSFKEDKGDKELIREIQARHENYSSLEELVLEIRQDGSNTLSWPIFGPVDYAEVAYDAASKAGVSGSELDAARDSNPDRPEEAYELFMLQKLVSDYVGGLSEEERKKLLEDVAGDVGSKSAFAAIGKAGIVAAIRMFGYRVVQQVVSRTVLWMGARQGAGWAASRVAGLLVPGLNIIMGAWLVLDIAGPAYRKTVPTVANIALLRLHKNAKEADRQSAEEW